MAERKPLYQTATGWPEEMAAADSMQLGGLTMGGNIAMGNHKMTGLAAGTGAGDALAYGQSGASLAGLGLTGNLAMGTNKITGLGDGSASTDAINKGQLDSAIITGGKLKEQLLHQNQLVNAEGVLSAIALTIQNNPQAGDLITITNGTTSRSYGATSGGDVQYAVGAGVADTMQNLANAILNDSSGAWSAAFTTALEAIDAQGVVVIYELDSAATLSKIYGTWTTPADCQVVDFYGEAEYSKSTLTNLPASSPTNANFGIHRIPSALVAGEIHNVRNNDVWYAWDEDDDLWVTMTGPSSIPDATSASGGGTKGKVTFDADYGLSVSSGVAKIDLASNKGLEFSSGDLAVKPDGTKAIAVGANGVAVKVETDGAIVIDGVNGGLELKLEATNPAVKIADNELDVKYQTAKGLDSDSSGLLVKVDGSTITYDGSGNLKASGSDEAIKIENTLTAAEAIAVADPVYQTSTANKFGKADAGTDAKSYPLAIARTSAAGDGNPFEAVTTGPCANVLSGATPGTRYFLQDTGGIGTGFPAAGKRVIEVGVAKNTTDLFVRIIDWGKRAAA